MPANSNSTSYKSTLSRGEEGYAFEEEYLLENLEISTSDFVAKVAVPDFRRAWEQMGTTNKVLEKFALRFKNLEDRIAVVLCFLGIQPCDGFAYNLYLINVKVLI